LGTTSQRLQAKLRQPTPHQLTLQTTSIHHHNTFRPHSSRPPPLVYLLFFNTHTTPQPWQTSKRSLVSSHAPSIHRMAHTDRADVEQFTEYYYKTFDADRSQLAPLYVRDYETYESKSEK